MANHAEHLIVLPGWGIFAQRHFRHYWLARFLASMGLQIVSVSIGWHVYHLTRNPFDLGLVGLMQFLPVLCLVPISGTVADRFDRRWVFGLAIIAVMFGAGVLWGLVLADTRRVGLILMVFLLFGAARSFLGPSIQAMLANLVPVDDLARAVAWNSTSWQTAIIVGPVVGGLLYGLDLSAPFAVAIMFFVASLGLVTTLPKPPPMARQDESGLQLLLGGFRYVWHEKLVLGAITLDLFAVFLGGAVALMPVFASDVLVLGPWGLGLLRAAPGIGAVGMAIYLSCYPIRSQAGLKMFASVVIFGLATIVFGLSHQGWLSIVALVVLGASDMISVNIRQTLLQLWTPDALRGRVGAVNMLSVGASNELGEFRAGSMASVFGIGPSVIIGGVGSIVVAFVWAWRFPALRRANHLNGRV
jgi:MFS family permease